MSELKIRAGVPADAEAIAHLLVDVQDVHAQGRPDLFHRFEADARQVLDDILAHLYSPAHHYLLAEAGGEVWGYVQMVTHERPANLYNHALRYLEVDQVSVSPAWRGQGIGEALMQATHDFARESNISRVILSVYAFNGDARRFYERLGYSTWQNRMEIILEETS